LKKYLLPIFAVVILNLLFVSSAFASTVQNPDGSFTYTQIVDENSAAQYYTLPSHGGGFEIYSWYNQDYGWMHDFPEWNTPGLTIQSAKLTVNAWDIDSEVTQIDGEYDGLSVDGVVLNPGYLQGFNEQWSITTFDVPVNAITDDGKVNAWLDIDMTHQYENWATTLNFSELSVNYVINESGNLPPYAPQITESGQVPAEQDIKVNVTGPVPADPDEDLVHYEYRWFVDVGNGFFVDDEFAGRNDHTGNTVPAADIAIGDKWRVQVTPIDEHNAVGPYSNSTWEVVEGVIPSIEGRMTGGGSIFTDDGMRVTHGFTLFKTPEKKSNNIQVNWNKGDKFHLTELKELSYVSLNDGFIVKGKGIGKLNNVDGAVIEFIFSDFGTPGVNDSAKIIISDADGNEVLHVENNLNKGNDQYHTN